MKFKRAYSPKCVYTCKAQNLYIRVVEYIFRQNVKSMRIFNIS